MERTSLKSEIVRKEKDKFVMKTTIEEEYGMEEAMKMIEKAKATIKQREEQKEKILENVKNKVWEKQIKNIDEMNKADKLFLEKAEEGVKEYTERLEEEGKKKVEFLKKKKGYDRLPLSSENKRIELKNQILNEVREELKIEDIQHPVMLKLRYECFKEKQEEEKNGEEKNR